MARALPALLAAASALGQASAVSLSARGGACTCLKWEQTYRSGMVSCGQGMELGTMLSQGMPREIAMMADHGCQMIYPSLEANYCLKAKQGAHLFGEYHDDYDYTWCYVSAACTELGGGAPVNRQVSWKKCLAGEDRRYADLNPQELMVHIKGAGMERDPTLMVVMSYPYLDVTWDQASPFFSGNPEAKRSLAPELRGRLQDVVDSGKPMMICTGLDSPGNGNPDACGQPYTLYVVVGRQLWYFPHFQTPKCVQGC